MRDPDDFDATVGEAGTPHRDRPGWDTPARDQGSAIPGPAPGTPAPASTPEASAPAPRRRGRPRSATVDRAILDATLRRLGVDGYQGLTFTAVAAEAKVGRPAIYRRYDNKAQLVAAAFLHASAIDEAALPTTTREALRSFVEAPAAALTVPGAMSILGSLMAEERRDPELLRSFRDLIFQPRHQVLRRILREGMARGEVREDLDVDAVMDLLFGALLARALAGGELSREWLDRIVATVWLAIASPGAG